jgi:hypothetical protein
MVKLIPSALPDPPPGYEWRIDLSDHQCEAIREDQRCELLTGHAGLHRATLTSQAQIVWDDNTPTFSDHLRS